MAIHNLKCWIAARRATLAANGEIARNESLISKLDYSKFPPAFEWLAIQIRVKFKKENPDIFR